MYIEKINLKNNYKRFFDLTIDLGDSRPKVVALVGPNGSGKSSIFDGLLVLQSRYIGVGASQNSDYKFHSGIADSTFFNKIMESINITFDKGDLGSVFDEKQRSGSGNTIFSFRSPYRYTPNLEVNEMSQIQDIKLNNIGAGSTIFIDEKITSNYKRLYSLIDRTVKNKELNFTYEQAKNKIIGELNSSLRNVLSIEIFDHGDILDGKGTLYFKKIDQVHEFSFNVLSSGEKEVVDILLDIYLKKEIFNDTIYLIDEPELHLNTSIQRKLLSEVIKLIPENCQLWIATHSIGFLNALKQDNIESEIIWFEGNFSQQQVVLKPIEKNRENWKKIFQTALEDLTGLIAPEKIIYCEGRKEPGKERQEQGMDAIIYNIIFEKEFPNILFVSSGGQSEPERYSEIALKIMNKAFSDVEIVLLKDRDINSDGQPTSMDQRDEWLKTEPKTRKMLKRKEIENYLFDIEILKLINPDIDTEKYNKIAPDLIDGEIKDKLQNDLKRMCGHEQTNRTVFYKLLAKLITQETVVYQELKEVIGL